MRRGIVLLLVIALLVGCAVSLHRRLLIAGGGASAAAPTQFNLEALFNGFDSTTAYRIGAATFDGATWTKYAGNPVLQPGSGGAWDDTHVKDPMLVHDGSQYVMFYSGHDGTKFQLGRATASAHTGPWTKDAGNPLLTVGTAGDFDDIGLEFATILREPSDTGREWKMWYGGLKNSDDRWRVGYAYSSDGESWTKFGQVLNIGTSGQWDDEGVIPFAIYKEAGTYHLFYGGRQMPIGGSTPFWQGGVATFTDPEGTYTRHAGNPTQLIRAFEPSSTSILLTANATPGSFGLSLTTTSVFSVGEVVVLTDTDTDAEVLEIASIDSATELTLESAITGTFTTANQGRLRPATRNGVVQRTVLDNPSGGYQMFGTAFQTLSDLTVGGSALRELSLRWTANSLTDTWTRDDASGLLLPLGGPGTWDVYSAENLSAIRPPS